MVRRAVKPRALRSPLASVASSLRRAAMNRATFWYAAV
jgi:hypothetical protein